MKILILSWRDPKNPLAGGAEILNLHILKPLIERGDEATWYSLAVPGLPGEEMYEKIKIVRKGNKVTHFLYLPFLLLVRAFGRVDLVIDCIHGFGYFTSVLMPNTRRKILICEVAQNIWDEMWPFPINVLGKGIERLVFIFYRNDLIWTISNSTKQDLVNFGVKKNQISVIPMGYDAILNLKRYPKNKQPSALFVGRLAEMKGVKDAINSIIQINQESDQKWELKIIGSGERGYVESLKEMVKKSDQERYIKFLGFVSEEDKFKEMSQAWVLLVPSSREGWGMIVPEANFVGTMALVYDSPGLRDVAPMSSNKNIIVKKGAENLIAELKKITKPTIVTNSLKSGWVNLYQYVNKQL